ncbi:MAG: terminase small subunit [Oscillospiraceae bacterium]
MAKLSPKRELFCQEYLVDLNGTQAAIRAGYSARAATTEASRLLTNANVRARIDILMAERSKRTGVNADRVIRELARIAFVNAEDVVDTRTGGVRSDASADDKAAIFSVKVKQGSGPDFTTDEREVKLFDKLKALELLGKHTGLWDDKANDKMPVQVVVTYDYGDDGDDGPTE